MMSLRDPICSASHLLTALWAAYATLILLKLTPPGRRLVVAVYGLSMVTLFLASGTFHGVPYTLADNPEAFRFFQKIDQSAIYLLIAGTNTPCLAFLLGGRRAKWFLGLMWGLAATGIAAMWLLPKVPHPVLISFYMGMGWLGLAPILHYYKALGPKAMRWMWCGAAFYTLGAVCELAEWPVIASFPTRFGFHEILHLCDSAGNIAFFVFISRHVIGFDPGRSAKNKPQDRPTSTSYPAWAPTAIPNPRPINRKVK